MENNTIISKKMRVLYTLIMILIYTTHPDLQTAKLISDKLLSKKLIACVNYSSIEACLIWKGVQTSENEVVVLYKTTPELWDQASEAIENAHPYEVPCIIKIEATANKSYENWVKEATI